LYFQASAIGYEAPVTDERERAVKADSNEGGYMPAGVGTFLSLLFSLVLTVELVSPSLIVALSCQLGTTEVERQDVRRGRATVWALRA
jgi:hypothetical protein